MIPYKACLNHKWDAKLGHSKYNCKEKDTDDSRNCYSKKTVVSSLGEIDLDIPRNRRGKFESQIVRKNQTDISNIEVQVFPHSFYFSQICPFKKIMYTVKKIKVIGASMRSVMC